MWRRRLTDGWCNKAVIAVILHTICTTAHARKSGIHLNFASSKNAFSGVILLFFLTVIFYYQFRIFTILHVLLTLAIITEVPGCIICCCYLIYVLSLLISKEDWHLKFNYILPFTNLEGKDCKSLIIFFINQSHNKIFCENAKSSLKIENFQIHYSILNNKKV